MTKVSSQEGPMIDENQLCSRVEEEIEALLPPISELEGLLRSIPNENLRKTTLRSLGEVIGQLDAIAYDFRKHLSAT